MAFVDYGEGFPLSAGGGEGPGTQKRGVKGCSWIFTSGEISFFRAGAGGICFVTKARCQQDVGVSVLSGGKKNNSLSVEKGRGVPGGPRPSGGGGSAGCEEIKTRGPRQNSGKL